MNVKFSSKNLVAILFLITSLLFFKSLKSFSPITATFRSSHHFRCVLNTSFMFYSKCYLLTISQNIFLFRSGTPGFKKSSSASCASRCSRIRWRWPAVTTSARTASSGPSRQRSSTARTAGKTSERTTASTSTKSAAKLSRLYSDTNIRA